MSCDELTDLMMCAYDNDYKRALHYIKYGNDVNEKNNNDNTALHLACRFNSWRLVIILLLYGANQNAVNNKGETPIIIAVKNNACTVIDMLLDKGVDLDIKDKHDHNVFDYIAFFGNFHIIKIFKKYIPI